VWTCNVKLHVHTCSGRNRIIHLMQRPNTDSKRNKSVTLPRNQLLIRYAGTSPVQTVTIWLRYEVMLQVCSHPKRFDICHVTEFSVSSFIADMMVFALWLLANYNAQLLEYFGRPVYCMSVFTAIVAMQAIYEPYQRRQDIPLYTTLHGFPSLA
jgi:hypothetical protein